MGDGFQGQGQFNHIRNEDHGYVDAAKTYLRMAQQGGPSSEAQRIKAEVLQELEQRNKKKGWIARLFGT